MLNVTCSNSPQLRYSLTLCEEEKNFVERRKACVFEAMQELLGEDAPKTVGEVRALE